MPRHSDTEANFVVRFRHLLELHGWKNLRKEMEISHGIRVDLAASPPGKHRFENAFIEIAQSKRVLKNKLLLIKRDSFGQIFSSNNVYLLVQIGKVRLEAENPQVSFIVYTPIGEIPFETGISELANSIDNALGKLEANFEAQQTKKRDAMKYFQMMLVL